MDTRKQLIEYLEAEGVTQTHIAKEIGVCRSMLNMYIHNKRNLTDTKEKALQNFLTEKTKVL